MLDKQFDNIINQKIKDLKLDVPESDWNVFSQKLKVAMESTGPQDHLFDEAIKSKLAAANIDTPKPEWNAFAATLNAELNTDTSDISDADFDAAIKEKVTNPDIEIPKADWPIMAALLAGIASTPDLSDSGFDNAIQNKLQNTSMDIPTPNWNAFSQKLQEASLSDQDLDTEVKAKLENYSTQFNESHWPILRDKMIETRFLRRNLYGLKWFEGALAILLFMTFSNFVADKFIPDSTTPYATTESAASSTAAVQSKILESTNINASTKAFAANAITSDEATNTLTASTRNADNNSQVDASISNTESSVAGNANQNKNTNTVISNNITASTHNITGISSKDLLKGETSLINTAITGDLNSVNSMAILSIDQDEHTQIAINDIEGLMPGLVDNSRDLLDLNLSTNPVVKITENIENNGWALHATLGNNNHMISTPQDTFVYQLPYTRSSNNLNFDVRVSKEINQVELMTGIGYQTLKYGSRVSEIITSEDKEFEFSIAEIRYELIQIPLAVRWKYGINNRLNFFADLGVSANILATSEYDLVGKELDQTTTTPKPQPVEELPDNVYATYENSSMARKNFQNGIFDGGTLTESIFGTLETGLGINFKLNNQLDTYARGTVNQALGQLNIGPNYDSFTTFGLQLGLKYKLGSK